MITADQYALLPKCMQEIIDYDYELSTFAKLDVIPFDPETRARFKHVVACRREAREEADRHWGYTARKTIVGPGPAIA